MTQHLLHYSTAVVIIFCVRAPIWVLYLGCSLKLCLSFHFFNHENMQWPSRQPDGGSWTNTWFCIYLAYIQLLQYIDIILPFLLTSVRHSGKGRFPAATFWPIFSNFSQFLANFLSLACTLHGAYRVFAFFQEIGFTLPENVLRAEMEEEEEDTEN